MNRYLTALLVTASAFWTIARAQDVVPAHHHQAGDVCPRCSSGACGACSECVRIAEIKKKQTPVYSCRIKEICVPTCNPFGCLFGCKGDCKKIEVRQLVKKYRTEEECVSKCATHEEAAKHYEAQAKRSAEAIKAAPPASVAPMRPAQPFLSIEGAPPVSLGAIAPVPANPARDD